MTSKCWISIRVLSLIVLASISRLPAGSQYEGWSAKEQALAEELGLDLSFQAGRFRLRPLGEQTWLSPWVVEGVVKRIENDPESFYRTKVRFHVDRYLKGDGPSDITLAFAYGKGNTADHKAMTSRRVIPSVVFSDGDVGKRYVVFINRGRILLPNGQELYPRGKNEFDASNRYWLKGEEALPDSDAGRDAKSYLYSEMVEEILRVAVPQAGLESKP